MKILIDTENKTLKLEGSVEFKKLQKFVKENKMEDWTILPETISVKEWIYPYYPYPYYRTNEWWISPYSTGTTAHLTTTTNGTIYITDMN